MIPKQNLLYKVKFTSRTRKSIDRLLQMNQTSVLTSNFIKYFGVSYLDQQQGDPFFALQFVRSKGDFHVEQVNLSEKGNANGRPLDIFPSYAIKQVFQTKISNIDK